MLKQFSQIVKTELEMLSLAKRIAQPILKKHHNLLIFLYGELGVGKTTLTRGILQGLGYSKKVKSPTYTLIESYDINDRSLFHFDLYRLKDPHELKEIGLQEYLSLPAAICIMEWPENGFPLLPSPDLAFHIVFKGSDRELKIEAHSSHGEEILMCLS